MTAVHVRSLSTDEELRRYVDFGQEVYRQTPNWVPPDAHHLTELLSGRSPLCAQSHVQAFWVEEGGRVLAVITAVSDEGYHRHWNERTGHLLFFEALPGCDGAVESLFRAAGDWLRERGCRGARLSFLAAWQMPLTIDAYGDVPTVFHTYNPAYYHSYIKNAGFTTEYGVVQYQVQFTPELARRYREIVERVTDSGVSLRPWDFDRPEEENQTFADIVNEAFAAHWGFSPVPAAAMREMTVEFKDFLVADFMVFAEAEGQTVGAVYSLPDLNQALHGMRGKAVEENFPELRRRLQEVDHGVLLIIGVRESHRGRGVNLALAAQSYLAMIERGYKTGSYTVVLDDNWPSRRTAEKLGARVTRNFNIYRKELTRPSA